MQIHQKGNPCVALGCLEVNMHEFAKQEVFKGKLPLLANGTHVGYIKLVSRHYNFVEEKPFVPEAVVETPVVEPVTEQPAIQ